MDRLKNVIPGINYGLDFTRMEKQIINYVRKLQKENKKLKKELERLTTTSK